MAGLFARNLTAGRRSLEEGHPPVISREKEEEKIYMKEKDSGGDATHREDVRRNNRGQSPQIYIYPRKTPTQRGQFVNLSHVVARRPSVTELVPSTPSRTPMACSVLGGCSKNRALTTKSRVLALPRLETYSLRF